MTAQTLNLITIGPWDFNGFDIGVLVILLVSLLYAASRGFLREIISIASLLVAVIVSLFVWGQFRFVAQDIIKPEKFADIVLVVGTFALTYLIMVLIMSKIGKTIAGKEPGLIDRTLGAGFGVLRGLIISALIVMVMTSGNRASEEAIADREEFIRQGIYDQVIKTVPKSYRDQMEAEPKPLIPMLANSTFYPLLNKIGTGLRALPFAKVKTYAERIKDGDLQGISQDILESGQ